jgi:hypothetical protein
LKPLYTQRPCETTETQKTYKQKIERKNNISFGSLHWYFSFDFAFLGGWKGHETKTENLRTLIIRRLSACVPDPFTQLGEDFSGIHDSIFHLIQFINVIHKIHETNDMDSAN